MKKIIKDSPILEKIFFRFVSYNIPNLQTYSKLVRFKLSDLLIGSLMKCVIYKKSHSKEFHQYQTMVGIRTGQYSVMRTGVKAKFNQYIIFPDNI